MPKKRFEIDKRSVRNLQRQFEQLRKTANKELSEELDGIMQNTLEKSKAQTPILTGRLRESGRLEQSSQGPTKKWEIKFGGVSVRRKFVDYAIQVHERTKRFLVPVFEKAKRATPKVLKRKMDSLLRAASKLRGYPESS